MSSPSGSPPTPPRRSQPSRYYAAGELVAGKYELVRPLGEGGMGTVWVARNALLDTEVAIKLIRADFDADDAGERLLQEARAAARLGHRAIVRIFDFGHTEQGDPFIVMELLVGESLADVLTARGRVTAIKAVQTLLPIVDALATAHERGIVHRDLKPENIFLSRETRRTQPKVVDFGIAKVDQRGAHRTLTRQGTVLGSPGYMSPEQARGLSSVDHRSDIWALSVVLYECVTARPAFQGENYNALMRSIIEDPVVPTLELAAGDADFWRILERGLKKDPGERWGSMHQFGAELAQWLLGHDVDQDVCGDPLASWLEESVPGRARDVLSVPPPSPVSGAPRRSIADTGRDDSVAVEGVRSNPPGPESTSAVVSSFSSVRPKAHVQTVAVATFLTLCAVVVVSILMFRGSHPSTEPIRVVGNSPATGAPSAAPPQPPPEARIADPAPPPLPPSSLKPSVPPVTTARSPRTPSAAARARAARAAAPSTADTSAKGRAATAPPGLNLKDPY